MRVPWQGSARYGRCGICLAVLLCAACDSGPTEPTLGSSWVAVAAGDRHTCGLTDTGAAFCWGDNADGQVGVRSSDQVVLAPTPVETDLRFVTLSAGARLTCGVTVEYAIYCWGSDVAGGRGTARVAICEKDGVTGSCPHVPVGVESDVEFVEVSVAGAYEYWDGTVQGGPVCGLGADDTAYCWGYGAFGARGDGTAASTSVPTPLAGDLRFDEIDVGEGGGCGITTSGALYCWGTNDRYRLARTDRDFSLTPLAIASPETWARVAVGPSHTCAVATDGHGWCWGTNDYGTLGDGTTQDRSVPTPVTGDLDLAVIVTASSHTAALDRRGRTYSWGYTYYTGTGAGGTVRQRILSPAPAAWSQALVTISAGSYHTCGLTPTGEAYCWGDGGSGQLGTGSQTPRSVPARLSPP